MITLTGRPISKKNSKQIIRSGNRYIPISSKAFKAWEESCLWQLKGKPKYTGKVMMSILFQMKGKIDADLDNIATSVIDILQKAKVIDDDKNIVHLTLSKLSGYEEWQTIIEIREI